MDLLGAPLPAASGALLLLALGLALAFEFVNGFHDTANAVATVIYTNSLRPNYAVVWSGLWNLIGVLTSSGAVAFGVTALLPVELVLNVGSAAGFAMVLALLSSAMIWNLGTWYFGIPASSSHSLIGAILGVGLANSLMKTGSAFTSGVNWAKAGEVGLSLLISPLIGFVLAAGLLLLLKKLIKDPEMFRPPDGDKPPPLWIRAILILTCTGVSFAHGSNDGQKGMGLIMLILVGILPGAYALNLAAPPENLTAIVRSIDDSRRVVAAQDGSPAGANRAVLLQELDSIRARLATSSSLMDLNLESRKALRTEIYRAASEMQKLQKAGLSEADLAQISSTKKGLEDLTRYIPAWVKLAVAIALGLGTTIGWKRIVVTVGEKIGKVHLSYAQGASAEMVAMTTIGAADILGLPVSTTHVLSSGVAGAMAANASGLQKSTLRNLLLAWVLTLPVCVFLGAMLFAFGLNLLTRFGI